MSDVGGGVNDLGAILPWRTHVLGGIFVWARSWMRENGRALSRTQTRTRNQVLRAQATPADSGTTRLLFVPLDVLFLAYSPLHLLHPVESTGEGGKGEMGKGKGES